MKRGFYMYQKHERKLVILLVVIAILLGIALLRRILMA